MLFLFLLKRSNRTVLHDTHAEVLALAGYIGEPHEDSLNVGLSSIRSGTSPQQTYLHATLLEIANTAAVQEVFRQRHPFDCHRTSDLFELNSNQLMN